MLNEMGKETFAFLRTVLLA